MPQILCVVDDPEKWPLKVHGVPVVSARHYLTDPQYSSLRHCRVYNLCHSYKYQSAGYYVSLLAEARGHKPLPRISTMQDLKFQSLTRAFSSELEELIQKSLRRLQSDRFVLSVYFGRSVNQGYATLARALFNVFPVPMFRVQFVREPDGWAVQSIRPIASDDVPESHRDVVLQAAETYFARPWIQRARKTPPRYTLAILVDPKEPTPPSDPKAIERFCDAAEKLGMGAEIIDMEDYGRLPEFDALFIRATTAVNNRTFRFARRAQAEGLVVIDDPESIVRCTNKVFLAELLARHHIPTPKTEILHRDNVEQVRQNLGLPLVLKQPDSSFSLGVVKVETEEAYAETVQRLLETSDLLIAQEFLRTDFDWRIGIIDRRPLYCCKYFMARGHWQIYNHQASGRDDTGAYETLPIELAPHRVVQTALRAANLIGNGLYGVDLKTIGNLCYVIEINDNPSLDSGVEDKMLKRYLYERIMEVFLKRIENLRDGRPSA